jgi:hypothetical protein
MCTVEAYIGKYVYSARNAGKGLARLFPRFLSLIHILPICFDSAQVLYIYIACLVLDSSRATVKNGNSISSFQTILHFFFTF